MEKISSSKRELRDRKYEYHHSKKFWKIQTRLGFSKLVQTYPNLFELCWSWNKLIKIKSSFKELIQIVFQTITHEIGHNVNMEHDFVCNKVEERQEDCDRFCETNPSQTCTNINSNMDYYEVLKIINTAAIKWNGMGTK